MDGIKAKYTTNNYAFFVKKTKRFTVFRGKHYLCIRFIQIYTK